LGSGSNLPVCAVKSTLTSKYKKGNTAMENVKYRGMKKKGKKKKGYGK
jgi:hypothetical protein